MKAEASVDIRPSYHLVSNKSSPRLDMFVSILSCSSYISAIMYCDPVEGRPILQHACSAILYVIVSETPSLPSATGPKEDSSTVPAKGRINLGIVDLEPKKARAD